jgi:parallel beta-helix repeat protein
MRFLTCCCDTSRAGRPAVLLAALLFSIPAFAATYYVSNSGLDTNPGTQAQPFATLGRALSRSAGSDTILLARGAVFREGGLAIGGSRTVGAYGPATLPRPVLAGSAVVTGWTPWAQNPQVLVATPSVTAIQQVYVDGRRMPLARTPNAGWLRTDTGTADNQIVDAALASLPGAASGYWTGAQVRWRKWSWIYETRTVSADTGAGTLTLAGATTLGGLAGIGSGYYLDNTLKALDSPGEWFYDSAANRLYLYPPSGAAAATMVVEAAYRPKAADLGGATVEDLAVQHFTTTGLGINNPSTLRRCLIQHIGGTGIGTSWNCSGTLITECTVRDILDNGITWVENPSGTGGSVVERSTLERIGSVPGLAGSGSWHGAGIIVNAAKALTIRLNHISETGYAGIILGNDGQTVTRNVFRRCMAALNDGAAIYTNCSASVITENIILDTVGDLDSSPPWTPLGHGIWPEFLEKFHDSQILNNTVYGSGGDGIWLPNNFACTVSGNVLVSNRLAGLSLGGYESAASGVLQENNTLQNNLLAIGARPWRPAPGQVQTLAAWASQNDYLLGFATFADFDIDFGTLTGTRLLTQNGADLVLRDGGTSRSLAQWQTEEAAWADPAPTTYQGNGYLFINDTEATVACPLPSGVTWQQLGGGAVGATVSLAPFRSVVLLATGGSVAGLSPYYLASGEAGPLSFAEWIAGYGLTGASAALAADPDGDGQSNLAEYAAALSPVSGTGAQPHQLAATAGGLEYTFRQRSGLVGATQQLETSADLITWTPVDTTSVTFVAVPGEPFVRTVKIALPASAAPRGFYRLKVSAP